MTNQSGIWIYMKYAPIIFFISLSSFALHSQPCAPDQESSERLQVKAGSHLDGPLKISELERSNMIQVRETREVLPFGYANKEWVEFKSTIKHGDDIYFHSYRNGQFYMDRYILIRDGCVVSYLNGKIS